MKKILLIGFIGAVIGASIAAILFLHFQPRPGQSNSMKVTENPTKEEEKKADVVIKEQKTGEITSRVPVKEPNPVPVPNNSPDPKPVLSLTVGDKFQVPATVKLETTYLNRSGREIGQGSHQVTGETTVTVGKDYLDISTKFQDSTTVAMEIPDKPWLDIYSGVKTNFKELHPIIGAEYGRPFKNNFYLTISADYDLISDWKGEYKALCRYRFNLE